MRHAAWSSYRLPTQTPRSIRRQDPKNSHQIVRLPTHLLLATSTPGYLSQRRSGGVSVLRYPARIEFAPVHVGEKSRKLDGQPESVRVVGSQGAFGEPRCFIVLQVGQAVRRPALYDTILLLVDGVERRQVRERVCDPVS